MSEPEIPFCFPIRRLENSRLILAPFDFATHAERYVQGTKGHPELFDYVGYGPFASIAEFSTLYDRVASRATEQLFAILARRDPDDNEGTLAGIMGFEEGNPKDATIEIGIITILPAFQRTFVTSNAVGSMLQYALDPPPDGLGLRRCQWKSHAGNEASRRVATRMAFSFEGMIRFHRIVPAGKPYNGHDAQGPLDAAGNRLGQSRDSAIFAHYCDEWPEKRKLVVAVMERK